MKNIKIHIKELPMYVYINNLTEDDTKKVQKKSGMKDRTLENATHKTNAHSLPRVFF